MSPIAGVSLAAALVAAAFTASAVVRSRATLREVKRTMDDLTSGECEIRWRQVNHPFGNSVRSALVMMCLNEPVERFTKLVLEHLRIEVVVNGYLRRYCTLYKMPIRVRDADLAGVAYMALWGKTPIWLVDPDGKSTFAVLLPLEGNPTDRESFETHISVTVPTWPRKQRLEYTLPAYPVA
jgi:hypothetical protein